jgi:ribosomal protein S18 acetylase RimI-like enzyme
MYLQQYNSAPAIRRGTPADLSAILDLHRAALPDFFLVNPGPAFLRVFYSLVLQDSQGLLFVSEHEGRFAGFAAAHTASERLYRLLAPSGLRYFAMFASCLAHRPAQLPVLWKDLRRAARVVHQCCPSNEAGGDVVALAVDPRCRMQGHGTALLRAVVEAAEASKTPQIRVNSGSKDIVIDAFYRKRGFQPHCMSALSDGRRMIEYVLLLQQGQERLSC